MSTTEPVGTLETTGAYPKYDEYEDSGIDWLGEIPRHWKTGPLKYFVSIDPEALTENTEGDFELNYVDIGSVSSTGEIKEPEEYKFEDAPSRARKVVQHGDTIISTVRTYLKAIAYIDSPPENLIVSTGFAVLRPLEEVDERFLGYLISSKQFIDSAVSHSEGIGYPSISTTKLGRLPVWLPPHDEQRAIATFLDRETGRIDALIEKKEELIDLLEEKRTALISRVVTEGLDRDVEMQDSGVEWLGEIPAHWETGPLKYFVSIDPEALTENTDDAFELRYVDIGSVNSTGEIEEPKEYKFEDAPSRARKAVQHGDTVISTVRTYLKAIAYIDSPPENLIVSTGFAVLRPLEGVDERFLGYLISSKQFIDSAVSHSEGIGYPSISTTKLGRLPIWLPPRDEQKVIARFLDRETERIDVLVDSIEDAITRLKEYRTALISAAVTGQIDVREEVATAPAE